MIKLQALTKYYKKHARGILDVSLEIKKGEIFGFIGPNGAGKSTTVRTLLNLIFPSSGSATVDGLDIVLDTIEDIMKTRAKTVRIKTENAFDVTSDMVNVERLNGYTTFVYTGEMKKLIDLLASLEIDDVTITEPALEEIFMHYYEREELK